MQQQWKAVAGSVAAVIAVAVVFGGISWMLNREKAEPPHSTGVTIQRPVPSPALSVPLAAVPPVEPIQANPNRPSAPPPPAAKVITVVPPAHVAPAKPPIPAAKAALVVPLAPAKPPPTIKLEIDEPRKNQLPVQAVATNVSLSFLMGPHAPVYSRGQTMLFFKLLEPEPITDGDLVPPDPFTVASSDADLTEWLRWWADGIRQGRRLSGLQQLDLPELLKRTPLKAVQLYQIGQGMEFVEGTPAAFPFWNAAIEKADQEMKDHVPGDPQDAPIFHALVNMGGLFDAGQFASVEKIHRIMKAHSPANSALAIRAEVCEAWAFLEAGRSNNATGYLEAVKIFSHVLSRSETLKLTQAEQGFLHWELGYALFNAGRSDQALEHFEFAFGMENQPYTERARGVYLIALVRTGKVDELKKQYDLWVERTKPTAEQAATMAESYRKMEEGAASAAGLNIRVMRQNPPMQLEADDLNPLLADTGPQGLSRFTLAAPGPITNVVHRLREISPNHTALWQERYWLQNGNVHLRQEELPNTKGYLFVDDVPEDVWAQTQLVFELIKTKNGTCEKTCPAAEVNSSIEHQSSVAPGDWRPGGGELLQAYELAIQPAALQRLRLKEMHLETNRATAPIGAWRDGSVLIWECVFSPGMHLRISERVSVDGKNIREQTWQSNAAIDPSQFNVACPAAR